MMCRLVDVIEVGTLLAIDETHTISVGPGGATQAWDLDPDIFVIGKSIGASKGREVMGWWLGFILGFIGLIIIGLMVIPYSDTNPLGSGYYTWKQRKFAIGTFLFGFIVLWVSMIIIGTFIRGPGWQWFWPGQVWDHNKVIYEVNRDLPDLFGITSMWAKTVFGAVVMGLYFAVAGGFFHKIITWIMAVQGLGMLALSGKLGVAGSVAVAAATISTSHWPCVTANSVARRSDTRSWCGEKLS